MYRLRVAMLASVISLTMGATLEGDGADTTGPRVIEAHTHEEMAQGLMVPGTKVWLPDVGLAEYKRLEKDFPGRVSGALRYPALERQIDVIKSIRPAVRTVLIPFPRDTECLLYDQAVALIAKAGLQVIRVDIEQDVTSLRQVARRIAEAQVLLMLPIPTIFEPHQMRYWVALTARHNVAMIGAWREDQVVAGAAAGWVASDAARASCQITYRAYLDRYGKWPERPCRPEVTYMENPHVLQHIGITMGAPER